jgi:disulfide oxidoreductase YuzD
MQFAPMLDNMRRQCSKQDLNLLIYNLEGVDGDVDYKVEDEHWRKHGAHCITKFGWPIRARWKPEVICDAMNRTGKAVLWLDADVLLCRDIIGFPHPEADITVALRRDRELKRYAKHIAESVVPSRTSFKGVSNAGVVFISRKKFVDAWAESTRQQEEVNDQYTLNDLINPLHEKPQEGIAHTPDFLVCFRGLEYNLNYQDMVREDAPRRPYVVHFKNRTWEQFVRQENNTPVFSGLPIFRIDEFDRRRLAEFLPKRGVGIELGVQRGVFSQQLLAQTEPKDLHLVDCWCEQDNGDRSGRESQDTHLKYYQKVCDWARLLPQVRIHREWIADAVRRFPDRYFDWAYVDGNHSYEDCLADLTAISPKIKKDGVIAGHDYCEDEAKGYGVVRAVSTFCSQSEWDLRYVFEDARRNDSYMLV